jgi:hypothetical protein
MKNKPLIAIFLLFSVLTLPAQQSLRAYNHVKLNDSTKVHFVAAPACPNCYYYLPTHFRVSTTESGQPEASFLKISETENSPVMGGIMHTLLVWGLDARQEAEAQLKIRAEFDTLAMLIGAVTVENPADATTLGIIGDDSFANALRAGAKNQSNAAVSPGTKMALSFRFDETEVQKILEYIEKGKATDAQFAADLYCVIPDPEGLGSRQLPLRLKLNAANLYPYFK